MLVGFYETRLFQGLKLYGAPGTGRTVHERAQVPEGGLEVVTLGLGCYNGDRHVGLDGRPDPDRGGGPADLVLGRGNRYKNRQQNRSGKSPPGLFPHHGTAR